MKRITCHVAVGFVAALFLTASSALAQITTGTVTGRVVDSSGGVIASAHVTLISEARGTRSAAVLTNDSGDYVFPNVTADTYTVEVTAPAFKTSAAHGDRGERRRPRRRAADDARSRRHRRNGHRHRRSGAGADAERRAVVRGPTRNRSKACRSPTELHQSGGFYSGRQWRRRHLSRRHRVWAAPARTTS